MYEPRHALLCQAGVSNFFGVGGTLWDCILAPKVSISKEHRVAAAACFPVVCGRDFQTCLMNVCWVCMLIVSACIQNCWVIEVYLSGVQVPQHHLWP